MQKGISYYFFFNLCLFISKKISPNFISNDTNDRGAVIKSFLCIYYMLWNTSRKKCSRKVVEKCLYSQYEQETHTKGREGSTFCGTLKPNKETMIKAVLEASKAL